MLMLNNEIAVKLFNVPIEELTEEQRAISQIINFNRFYGMPNMQIASTDFLKVAVIVTKYTVKN